MTNEELITKLLKKIYRQDAFLNGLRIRAENVYIQAREELYTVPGVCCPLMSDIIDLTDALDEHCYLDEEED
jgi:hypothetical protein